MYRKVNYQDVLIRVATIWICCYGALTLQVVAGYFMSHILLPYIGFVLMGGIIVLGNRNISRSQINCSLMTHYTVYILAVSGVIMLMANLMNTNFITNRYSQFSHQNYPFHASFIVYPVAAVLFGLSMLRRGSPRYCKQCRSASEFSIKEALRRNVLHHESKVQIRLAFMISLVMSVVTYLYYFCFYRSGLDSRRYSPDVFFMYILPAVVYGISVVYVLSRLFSIEVEVHLKKGYNDHERASRVRYMVVWRDNLLLKDIFGNGEAAMWDTPADLPVDPSSNITVWDAEKAFRKFYGSDDFKLKRLFSSQGPWLNFLHCAAFLDEESDEVNSMGGEWFSLRDVDMMLSMGLVARPFAVELHRVFTITMAWKTYDREGRRLYPIKNYRPTFRLRDFKDWDVDYADMHWMEVARNNQDKPFYRLRRLLAKYFKGLDSEQTV